MQTVLLVDTNFSAVPIHNYLVQAGYEVYVCGNNTEDFLAKSSDNYINIDYCDLEQMRSLIQSRGFDYIVPGCNDRSYQACTEINLHGQLAGLDSCKVTETINNKERFRTFAAQIGLPVPRVIPVADVGAIWPLIVKPVDAYSGRGMTVVQQSGRNELGAAIERAESFSRTRTCIIEEYVAGQLYSHSAFLSDNTIVAEFIVEEYGTANPFAVDTSRVVYDFPADVLNRVRTSILILAKHLDLVDGLIHTQFISNGSSFWLIEITRRCPGDLYGTLIESSTGYGYAEAYAKPFLKQKVAVAGQPLNHSFVLRHTISEPEERVFESVQFNTALQIEKFVPLCRAGDKVSGSPFGRIGLLFARTSSQVGLCSLLEMAIKRELYCIH